MIRKIIQSKVLYFLLERNNARYLVYQCITVRPRLSVRPFVHLFHFSYILLKDLVALFCIELMYFNMEHAVLYLETKLHGEIQQNFK